MEDGVPDKQILPLSKITITGGRKLAVGALVEHGARQGKVVSIDPELGIETCFDNSSRFCPECTIKDCPIRVGRQKEIG